MLMLVLSVLALAMGPLAFGAADRLKVARLRTGLEVLTIIAVGGLTLVQILPEIFREMGLIALVPLGIGLLGPTVLERWMRNLAGPAHLAVRLLVVVGLCVHEFIDGVALAVPALSHSHAAEALPLAIVVHRVSLGLILWWLLRPRYGVGIAFGALTLFGLSTVGGYLAGPSVIGGLDEQQLAMFEALVAGSLLHVAVHQREHHHGDGAQVHVH